MNRQEIISDIVSRVQSARKVHKIILFGSYAHGDPDESSDLDLIVVLEKNKPRSNYEEQKTDYLSISRALRGIRKDVPIDLIVYSIPEYQHFIDSESQFARTIAKDGIILA